VECIKRVRKAIPDALVGAGTVLTLEQASQAIAAGASYVNSPSYNPEIVQQCFERGVTMIPGCATPTEIDRVRRKGLETVKIFPAEQLGGAAFIKAVSVVFPMLRFVPTGGINADNLASYLALDNVLACGGSWIAREDLILAHNWDEITRLAKQASEIAFK
jgi:2-dehydro-3-deoxyphosphogluconate aldolase/(4S)-4-hydroxy-2-oxoglutarate aldolase